MPFCSIFLLSSPPFFIQVTISVLNDYVCVKGSGAFVWDGMKGVNSGLQDDTDAFARERMAL